MAGVFPKEFADLEAVGRPWAIVSYEERQKKLLRSSMEDIEAFYDAVFPRAKQILTYCDGFDICKTPDEVKALLNLLCSLIAVSLPVELWKQAGVRDSAARVNIPTSNHCAVAASRSPGRA